MIVYGAHGPCALCDVRHATAPPCFVRRFPAQFPNLTYRPGTMGTGSAGISGRAFWRWACSDSHAAYSRHRCRGSQTAHRPLVCIHIRPAQHLQSLRSAYRDLVCAPTAAKVRAWGGQRDTQCPTPDSTLRPPPPLPLFSPTPQLLLGRERASAVSDSQCKASLNVLPFFVNGIAMYTVLPPPGCRTANGSLPPIV